MAVIPSPFQTIQDTRFLGGMDGLSPVDAIPDGYTADLLNVSPNRAGELVGRPGTFTRAGDIPLRVHAIAGTATGKLLLTLDGAISSLWSIPKGPILLRGRTSVVGNPTNAGTFKNNAINEKWYPTFNFSDISEFTAGGSTTLSSTGWVIPCTYAKEGTDLELLSELVPDAATISYLAPEVTITTDSVSSIPCVSFLISAPVVAGDCFVKEFSVPQSGTIQTLTIPFSEHAISGTDFIVTMFDVTLSGASMSIPSEVRVLDNGDLEVDVWQNAPGTATITAHIKKGSSSGVSVLGNLGDVTVSVPCATPFVKGQCYWRNQGKWHMVLPNAMVFDSTLGTLTATLSNLNGIDVADVKLVAVFGDSVIRSIWVQDVAATAYSDIAPEMCLYGMDSGRLGLGQVDLLDCYRDAADESPVVIAARVPYLEQRDNRQATIQCEAKVIALNGAGSWPVGPAFSTVPTLRAAGNLIHDNIKGNTARCRIVSINASTLECHIALDLPGYVLEAGAIATQDLLTLTSFPFAELNTDCPVLAVDASDANILVLDVQLSTLPIGRSAASLAGVRGTCAIFTDIINLDRACPFLPGDRIAYGGSYDLLAVAARGNAVQVSSSTLVTVTIDRILRASRLAATEIPIPGHNFVRGDSVIVSGWRRRVLSAAADAITVLPVDIVAGGTVYSPARWEAIEAFRDVAATRAPQSSVLTCDFSEPMLSCGMNKNLYAASGYNYPVALTAAGSRDVGLPSWNPLVSIVLEEVAGLPVIDVSISTTGTSGSGFIVVAGDELRVNNGETYAIIDNTNTIGARLGTCTINNPAVPVSGRIYVSNVIGTLGGSTDVCTLQRITRVRYYARLRSTDEHGNRIIGPTCGLADASVEVTSYNTVTLTLAEPPNLGAWEYARGVYIDIFRTRLNDQSDPLKQAFYLLTTLPCEFKTNLPYQVYRDQAGDDLLGDIDVASTALVSSLTNSPYSSLIQPLPRCKAMTTIGNRMCIANITDDLGITLNLARLDSTTNAVLDGMTIALTPTDSAFGDVQTYQLMAASQVASCTRAGSTVTCVTTNDLTWSAGVWVFMSPDIPSNPTDKVAPAGWFRTLSGSGQTFTIQSPGEQGSLVQADVFACYDDLNATDAPNEFIPVPLGDIGAWSQTAVGGRTDIDAAVFRLAHAISCVNSILNPLQPFMARAGAGYASGDCRIWCPRPVSATVLAGTIECNFNSTVLVSLDGTKIAKETVYPLLERVWASRLLVSGKLYPEAVIGYDLLNEEGGASVLDVNPSDGDEIMAVRPFLSSSVFSASQQQQQLLVFKRRSIYVVSIDLFLNKGADYLQQIVSNGDGASSSTGIAYTGDGMLMVNYDSIILLTKDLQIDNSGLKIGRQLLDADFANAALYAGHADVNSFLTSDHHIWQYLPETKAFSHWTLPGAIAGMCSVKQDVLAAIPGRVLMFSDTLNDDDGVAFRQEVSFRASNFGDGSIQKQGGFVFVNMGTAGWPIGAEAQVNVDFQADLRPVWLPCSQARPKGPTQDDNLTSEVMPTRSVLRYDCPSKRFQTLQIRVWMESNVRMAVSNLSYKVKAMDPSGAGTESAGG